MSLASKIGAKNLSTHHGGQTAAELVEDLPLLRLLVEDV